MEINLEQLKKNFVTIKDIRSKVTNVFDILEMHLIKLKNTYGEFVENNRQNLFVFGLDSFQFQSKLIDIEYDDMKRLFLAINNRMYCEYYKLYKIIVEYVKDNIPVKKTLELIKLTNNFPVYKDLEPYKQYKFDLIQGLHENILLLLYEINDFIVNKENELDIHKKKQDIGLNINNFVTTFNYNILMIKEKGILFMSYIEFFHNLHTKYLQRFAMKMNLMYNQVTHDIRFEDSPTTLEIKKQELINNFESDNIDKSLIKEIRRSFNDSDSGSSDSPEKCDNISIKIVEKTLPIIEASVSITDIDKAKSIMEKTKSTSNTESLNSPRLLTNNNRKYKTIIKDNVKKIISGMNLFKKKNEDINSSESSESISGDNTKSPDTPITENTELEEENKTDDMTIHKSKSAEEIFMEISKQCNELTVSSMYSKKLNSIDILSMDYNGDTNDEETSPNKSQVIENQLDPILLEPLIGENIIKDEIDIDNNDEMMSVITMECILDNKEEKEEKEENDELKIDLAGAAETNKESIEVVKEELLNDSDDINQETLEKNDENPKKKKRTYKPRKKN